MKHAAILLTALWSTFAQVQATRGDEVRIVVDKPLPIASARAVTELRAALAARGNQVSDATLWSDHAVPTIVVGLAGQSTAADAALALANRTVPKQAEAAAIVEAPSASKTIVLAGHDDRGLTYALRDAARSVAVTPAEKKWWEGLTFAIEQPFLRVRNVSVHLFNADCEREWFFSEEFWRFYFQRLSLSRFNRCTLTFCDQTNYLCPPYAYLVAMPEYPEVKVADCTPEQREQNLAMVRRIAELADEYAVDFDLGIWMQAPVEKWAAPVKVTGLPEGMELAKYCALGLRRILEACPSIDGLQLRMNAEAGVPEDQQTDFYRPMFQAMAAFQKTTGRPLRLDLRYKGLTDATINAALDEKLDVTVSTKFWSEHLGMPYHPTVVDSHYAADRYSFGTLLKKPRRYQVTYQLWNVGSNRLTLWGDPAYCSQFAKSCTLGGGEGFEVFAPLTNKGYGNRAGAWQVIKNPDYRVGRWEQERYWMFYLCFGRMGYNPATNPEIWQREFRHRFGDAAEPIEKAYAAASRVLPLITTALLPSASEWYWWPEMDTGGDLQTYARIQTSDPGMVAAVRRWKRTPSWRWEEWDERPGFVEELETQKRSGRCSPLDMHSQLSAVAQEIDANLAQARNSRHPPDAEGRITAVDLQLLQGLAEYHSGKLLAATSDGLGDQLHAETGAQRARESWQKIVTVTDDVYHDDLVFGITPDMPRSKQGHHHSGHWRDRLAEVMAEAVATDGKPNPIQPVAETKPLYDVSHLPSASRRADAPLEIRVVTIDQFGKVFDPQRQRNVPQRVMVRVRALDQTQAWREYELKPQVEIDGAQPWIVSIPADALDPQFDVQYYFVCVPAVGGPHLWPDWRKGQPYFVVPVETKSVP